MIPKNDVRVLSVALFLLFTISAFANGKCPNEPEDCANRIREALSRRGWVGLTLEDTGFGAGRLIVEVAPGSPAEKSGLRPGDVVLALNGTTYSRANDAELKEVFRKVMTPGNVIVYRVLRGAEEIDVEIGLEHVPAEKVQEYIDEHIREHHSADASAPGQDESRSGPD